MEFTNVIQSFDELLYQEQKPNIFIQIRMIRTVEWKNGVIQLGRVSARPEVLIFCWLPFCGTHQTANFAINCSYLRTKHRRQIKSNLQ